MWIVAGPLPVLLVGIVIAFGILMTEWCPSFLCEDWGQIVRGDSYAELRRYEKAIQEYDETLHVLNSTPISTTVEA